MGLGPIEYGPGMNGPNQFDWEGWAVPLVTSHDYFVDFDWHIDWRAFGLRWSEEFLLRNPVVSPPQSVPVWARFSGEQNFAPLRDEAVLLRWPSVDYTYRVRADAPGHSNLQWWDTHSDMCIGNDCSVFDPAMGTNRGPVTRHDWWGNGYIARQDESLQTTGIGSVWSVPLSPFSGVDTCVARPAPTNFSLAAKRLQCSPEMCALFVQKPLGEEMYWSNASTWRAIAQQVGGKMLADATRLCGLPREGDIIEIPAGFNIVLDVDPPPLEKLLIAGRLAFERGHSRKLEVSPCARRGAGVGLGVGL